METVTISLVELFKIHSSFLIIIGGQLVLFHSKKKQLHELSKKSILESKAFSRFSDFMKSLDILENIVLGSVLYPTFCVLIQVIIGLDNNPLLSIKGHFCWYLISFIIVIIIQFFAYVNYGYNQKNIEKFGASLEEL